MQTPDPLLFHDVFNASPIGIVVENMDGQPLFVNPAFCTLLGFTEEELHSKHCVDFSPPEDAERDWVLFQQLRAGSIDHYQLEKRYFRRDGSLVWGRVSISLLNSRPSPLVIAMVEDITDKKKAEDARFRHAVIIESSDDAIATATPDGIIVSWNAGAQKMYGYTEAEAVGKPINMLVPPELPDEENQILEKLKSGDRIEHFETVRVAKTGKRINVSLTVLPIKDTTGRTVGISGIARDINERKLTEEALRASEERLRLAQQTARIGAFDWNIQTEVNTWTPELEAMYGLPPGGFGGTQTAFENLVHPDDRAGVIKLVDAAMKSGQPTDGEWRVVWPDGSVHWIAGRWQVFMDTSGQPSKMIGVNVDVTQRKCAEEALHESEERFRLAAQAGKMFAYAWDAATDKIVRSEGVMPILGIDAGAHTTGQEILTIVPPEDRARLIAAIAQLSPEQPHLRISYRMVRSDGSVIWIERTSLAYFDEQGRMLRIVGMIADITERKLAETALAEVSHKLLQAQEQERNRIGRELHDDINQRLAMLSIELQQLQERPVEFQERVQHLQAEMAEISNDVQALSHELNTSKLEYLGFVAGMRSWCKEFGERQRIEVNFKTDVITLIPKEIGVTLFRISQEALHNAVKHSGVRRVEVQLSEHSHEIHLTISDTGKGFDIETVRQGRGLGLASMEERVRLVNGTIAIDSKPLGGTSIRVSIPIGQEQDSERVAG